VFVEAKVIRSRNCVDLVEILKKLWPIRAMEMEEGMDLVSSQFAGDRCAVVLIVRCSDLN
jgi:hypothetical protein